MTQTKCYAWRVECPKTRDGVIFAKGSDAVFDFLDVSHDTMCPITNDKEIYDMVRASGAKFGFTSLRAIKRMCKYPKEIGKHGFVLSKYEVVPLFIYEPDTQVIFSEMRLIKEFKL